jgi:hypothetical protein
LIFLDRSEARAYGFGQASQNISFSSYGSLMIDE